ncbi:MAG: DUF4238 domain-containing protein [Defluviitaleaceae bacterium]|nr:DUF4238 domain-containing protein [Defluviitaleaceae bacterium]
MKKRRQHYVFQQYLRAWTVDGQIFCLRNGKIFPTNTVNVAQERDFYKLEELTEEGITLINSFISRMNPAYQNANKGWIEFFRLVFIVKQWYEQFEEKHLEIEELLNEVINNFEEELHCMIEGEGINPLNNILNGDISFSEEDSWHDFCFFLAMQYFRTKKIRERIKCAIIDTSNTFQTSGRFGYVEHIFSCIFATNMGFSLSQMNIMLLENKTSIPFITADQPVINIRADYLNGIQADEIELYYPVSPQIAVIIFENDNRTFVTSLASICDVKKLNDLIFNVSREQIYSNTKESLEKYK